MTTLAFERYPGEQTLAMLGDIADLYAEIRSGNPDEQDEMFSRPSFIARTTSQVQAPGFELVLARAGDAPAGFSFGYPFSPGQWWAECTPPSRQVLDAPKFAVIELDVRQAWQGQGIGKKLLHELLVGRMEKFATLAATPGSQAYAMYVRWGWHKAGAFITPPPMDALLTPLNDLGAHTSQIGDRPAQEPCSAEDQQTDVAMIPPAGIGPNALSRPVGQDSWHNPWGFRGAIAGGTCAGGNLPLLAYVGYCGRYLPSIAADRWLGYAEDVPWTGIRPKI